MWNCPTMSDNSLSTPAVGYLSIIVYQHTSTCINVHHANRCGICVNMVNTMKVSPLYIILPSLNVLAMTEES